MIALRFQWIRVLAPAIYAAAVLLASGTPAVAQFTANTAPRADEIHWRSIEISPSGTFIEGAAVYRSGTTGGGIGTSLADIPLAHSDAAQISDAHGSARQSRAALKATGQLSEMALTGYFEMDWLGNGGTPNSYIPRLRQLWGRAALADGWSFTAGKMWSLATETLQGMEAGTEALPLTIDPSYTAGFVWRRQYGFRAVRMLGDSVWLGASIEDAQGLAPAGNNLPSEIMIGATEAGNGGTNDSCNAAPDLIAKAVFQPGWGHYEVFGIARFFPDRVCSGAGEPSNQTTMAGGIGGGFRVPVFHDKITAGLKGLWGQGLGRYGSSKIADVTLRPSGAVAPLRTFSALGTLEFRANTRWTFWSNYGGDSVGRRYYGAEGYGSPLTDNTGCNARAPAGSVVPSASQVSPSPAPEHCFGTTKDVQEFSAGYWFDIYSGSKGKVRQGIQYSRFQRNIWSGIGGGARGVDHGFWASFRYYLP